MITHQGSYSTKSLLEVINSLPLAITVIDQNRKVILANKSTTGFVSKNQTQLIGRVGGDAFGCIHAQDSELGCGFGKNCLRCRLRQAVADTLENAISHEMLETSMVFKDLGLRHLRICTQPLILDGEPSALLAIQDITQIRINEDLRLEKERLAAAVKTAGAICHEVNQPLMIIMGMAELLLQDAQETHPHSSHLKEIKKQAERLGRVTKKLLTLSDYHTRPYLQQEILDLDKSSAP